MAIRRRIVDLSNPAVKANVAFLYRHGLTLHQILEQPTVLQYSHDELATRVKSVRGAVTAHELCNGFAGHAMRHRDDVVDQPWLQYLARRLDCSVNEIMRHAPLKLNALYPRSHQNVIDKLDTLLEAGATKQQILTSLGVLNRGLETIRERISFLRANGLDRPELPIKLLSQGGRHYQNMVRYRLRLKDIIGSHVDQWHYLAHRLNTSPVIAKQVFENVDLRWLIPKIDLLLDMGVSGDDILLRPKLTAFSLERLQKLKAIFEKYDMDMRPGVMGYFLAQDAFPRGSTETLMQTIVCDLLRCDSGDLRLAWPYMQLALQSSPKSLEKCVNVLTDHGVTLADIRSCPLVLNHGADDLSRALTGHPDLLPLQQWCQNSRLVNALVYVLERDRNFREENGVTDQPEPETTDQTSFAPRWMGSVNTDGSPAQTDDVALSDDVTFSDGVDFQISDLDDDVIFSEGYGNAMRDYWSHISRSARV